MAPSVVKNNVDSCPDLETIAAFLDGQLEPRERSRMTAHLGDCESCYFVFTEAAQMRASEASLKETAQSLKTPVAATPPVRKWPGRKMVWSSTAGLAAAASLILAVATGVIPWGGDSTNLRELVTAVGTYRPVEARVSGGFTYGPVSAPKRGPESASESPDVRIAVASLEKEATRRTTARSLHELGIAYLATGDMPRAITTLEDSANRSDNPRVLSDLAAAYLARGVRESRPQDVSRALALANLAVKRDPSMPEALFNRALALEHLSIFDDARQAWQAYLKVDDQSGWAAEARNHLQKLGGD